jgi:CRP-like cAMP-binding protein
VPRTASVSAETDIVAEVLNRREFVSLLDQEPPVMKKILVGTLRRLHELQT